MGKLPTHKQRISIVLTRELVDDIYFEIGKIHRISDPQTSLGKYIENKLRPLIAERNTQVTPDMIPNDDD